MRKALALCAVVSGVLFGLYTGSRGGFLGFLGFAVLFFLLRMGPVKKLHKGMMLIVLTLAISLNADKINFERYIGITDLSEDYNLSNEFGRKAIWEKGVDIFFEYPLLAWASARLWRQSARCMT
jgi:O-antigen ligase